MTEQEHIEAKLKKVRDIKLLNVWDVEKILGYKLLEIYRLRNEREFEKSDAIRDEVIPLGRTFNHKSPMSIPNTLKGFEYRVLPNGDLDLFGDLKIGGQETDIWFRVQNGKLKDYPAIQRINRAIGRYDYKSDKVLI